MLLANAELSRFLPYRKLGDWRLAIGDGQFRIEVSEVMPMP
jgi:hypothetical protein